MSNQNKTFSVRKLAIIGLLSALVFIFSWVQVPIGQIARVHLGNVFCVLSGLLFGPLVGGLSSGFGSMLFDFTNPVYIAESWITFITKFFIGFLAGLIAHHGGKSPTLPRDVLGAVVGSVTYIVLYLTKSFIFMTIEGQATGAIWSGLVLKGATSLLNAVFAVLFSVLLAKLLRPALTRAGILPTPKLSNPQ